MHEAYRDRHKTGLAKFPELLTSGLDIYRLQDANNFAAARLNEGWVGFVQFRVRKRIQFVIFHRHALFDFYNLVEQDLRFPDIQVEQFWARAIAYFTQVSEP